MIEQFDHVVLTVADIEASIAFFKRVLLMRDSTFGDGRRALHFGSQKINLQVLGQEQRNRAAVGSGDICLITSWTIENVVMHLRAESVDILEGPVTKSGANGAITSVYFNDLDGNLIEVSVYPPV